MLGTVKGNVKKRSCVIFLFQAADDPEESWLKTENSRLEGDVDALHVKIEQIQQDLMAKDQKLKDLGNIHSGTLLNLLLLKYLIEFGILRGF